MSTLFPGGRDRLRLSRRQMLTGSAGALAAAMLAPRPARAYRAGPVSDGGRISGVVRYSGRALPPARVKLSGDCSYCRRFDLRREDLLVSDKGGLRNVVVYLEAISSGKPPPPGQPTLAEERCTFVPHVSSITAGTKLLLHNRDPVLNTFHFIALPENRTLFNIGMPNRDQKAVRRIREPGVIRVLCDVHPWEVAYVVSIPHPYHAVTDAEGRFELADVPPGSYTVALWHEKLGSRKRPVKLAPAAGATLTVSY